MERICLFLRKFSCFFFESNAHGGRTAQTARREPDHTTTATRRNSSRQKKEATDESITPTITANVSRIQSSSYFKMRPLLRDIRPHVMEVLRTPDFRNCRAAQEIRERLKLLMDLYKLMVEEPISKSKLDNFPGQADPYQPPSHHSAAKLSETVTTERQQLPKTDPRGTYIVGGSAPGWNFITLPGQKPTYSGVTKESFRANRVKPRGW